LDGIDGWNDKANGIRWNGMHKRSGFACFFNPGDPLLTSNTTFTPNDETFITYEVQRKDGVWSQYFNGVKDANTATDAREFDLCHTTGMIIGGGNWDGYDSYHTGKIKSIKIYSKAKYNS